MHGLMLFRLGRGVGVYLVEHELPQRIRRFADDGVHIDHAAAARLNHGADHGVDTDPAVGTQHGPDIKRQVVVCEDAAADGVVHVVVDIGDLVRNAHNLPLQRPRIEAAGVAEHGVEHLVCQVESPARLFQRRRNPHALFVVGIPQRADAAQRPLSPACPNGVCPRSCPSAAASTRSSFRRSARAIVRPICATSSVCVSRVR